MIRATKKHRTKDYIWLVNEVPWCYLLSDFMMEALDEADIIFELGGALR